MSYAVVEVSGNDTSAEVKLQAMFVWGFFARAVCVCMTFVAATGGDPADKRGWKGRLWVDEWTRSG